ncbi:MAG: hypothetical protein EA357_03230 [Micavibrio sp.]|nr:MAG: hypothetical protein EA357_03230 [Micavibrio sp.]
MVYYVIYFGGVPLFKLRLQQEGVCLMDFQDTRLPASAESDYNRLDKAVKALVTKDAYTAEEQLVSVLDRIKKYDGDEAKTALAAKAYADAYDLLASAPEFYAQTGARVDETVEKMLERFQNGSFQSGEDAPQVTDETLLNNVRLVAGSMINRAAMDKEYAATGLPDNPAVRLAYEAFMEDIITNQTAAEQQIEAQAEMAGLDADKMKQAFYGDQNEMIDNTIRAAQKFAQAARYDDPEAQKKAAVPFLVYSALNGQYRDDEESFKEDFDEHLRYQVDSTIWGAYSLVDQVETYFAKDSMFQIAQVPLSPIGETPAGEDAEKTGDKKPEADAEKTADAAAAATDGEKQQIKTVPLPQAVEFFESQGNVDAARGAVRAAFVTLVHGETGENLTFPLSAVFEKIEQDPEYRARVVSDIQTGLPPMMPLSNMIAAGVMGKATTAGKLISSSQTALGALDGVPGAEEMKKALQPLENDITGKYVFAVQNMPANEDTAATAEFLMVNAMITLDNMTAGVSRLSTSLFGEMGGGYQTDFVYLDERRQPGGMLNFIPVDAVAPEIERAVDHMLAVQKIFTEEPGKDDQEFKLKEQFKTVPEDMQRQFKYYLSDKTRHLTGLQQVLINTVKKREQQGAFDAAYQEELKKQAEALEAQGQGGQKQDAPEQDAAKPEAEKQDTEKQDTKAEPTKQDMQADSDQGKEAVKPAEKPPQQKPPRKKRWGLF